MLSGLRLVSEAAELAARRHAGQQRKGRDEEPYVNHLAEVANILSTCNEEDAELVAAGWLHDTIEDTDTTHDELAERFGERVAGIVAEVTDDMTLPKAERRRIQIVEAPKKSDNAKQIKIADKISNIRARIFFEPDLEQQLELMEYLGWAEQVVAGCRGVNARLDALFDETVANARGTL
jgi:guanosine-3',5'-bis(diphosphate) 3'-pyrophosphohydrolase